MQQNIIKHLKNHEKNIRFHPDKFVKTNCSNEPNNKEAASGKGNSFGLWDFWRFVLLQDRGAATEACWLAEKRAEGWTSTRFSETARSKRQFPSKTIHNLEDVAFMPGSTNLMALTSRNKNSLIFWITTAGLLIDDCVKVWDVDKNLATRTYGFKGPVTKLTTSNALPNHIWFNTDKKKQNIAEADIRAPKYQTLKLDLAQNESFLG